MTLDLSPHLDETIERVDAGPLPRLAIDRYRAVARAAPEFLQTSGPPFARGSDVELWRFAGSLIVRASGGCYALNRDDTLDELPVSVEEAEKHLRWPEAYAQPERGALLISAWLELTPLLDQAEVEAVSAPAMALMAFAPPRLAETWRAPAREDDELIFYAGTPATRARNRIVCVRANLASRWLELEDVCEGWHQPPPVAEVPYEPPDALPDDIVPITNPVRDPVPRLFNLVRDLFRRDR